jgi:DNA invertase Pin-like site-specific DNA recombinase
LVALSAVDSNAYENLLKSAANCHQSDYNTKTAWSQGFSANYGKIVENHARKAKVLYDSNQAKKMARDYRDGKSLSMISIEYGLSRTTARRIMAEHGVDIEKHRRSSIIGSESRILGLYKDGISAKKISEQLEISHPSVLKFLQRQGVYA